MGKAAEPDAFDSVPVCVSLDLVDVASASGLSLVDECPGVAPAVLLEDFLRARPDGVIVSAPDTLEVNPPLVRTLAQALAEADRLSRAGATQWSLSEAVTGRRHAVIIRLRDGVLIESADVPSRPSDLTRPTFRIAGSHRLLPRSSRRLLGGHGTQTGRGRRASKSSIPRTAHRPWCPSQRDCPPG